MDNQTRQEYMFKLETVIDAIGLINVLEMIGEICAGKAAHIRHNWQDNLLADQWSKNAKRIDRVAERVNCD